MVVGLDWGIKKVADAAKEVLGENTIIVVSSDNGGSVWFGGLNEPLRSGKHTSFEGGVRVPAFAVDLSGGKYLGQGGREFKGMVHISDWLPTFLSLAHSTHLYEDMELDGVDQSEALVTGEKVTFGLNVVSLFNLFCSKEKMSSLICTLQLILMMLEACLLTEKAISR